MRTGEHINRYKDAPNKVEQRMIERLDAIKEPEIKFRGKTNFREFHKTGLRKVRGSEFIEAWDKMWGLKEIEV